MSVVLDCSEIECGQAPFAHEARAARKWLLAVAAIVSLLLLAAALLLPYAGWVREDLGQLSPAAGPPGEAKALRDQFYHDFRGRPLPPELLFREEEAKYFQQEPEGLRITIPKTWTHPWGGVGVWTAFGLQGDFEITTTYEILKAETPPGGYGVGLTFSVVRPDNAGNASISRLVRAEDKQVMLWDVATGVPGKNRQNREGVSPCQANVGRMRLTRTGTTMHYLWAPGTQGGDFQEIHQHEFGDMALDRVRLAALTGRKPCDVSVRLIDLRIRSEASDPPASPPPSPPPPKTDAMPWLGIALAAAAPLGVWIAVRQSRRRRESPAQAEQNLPASTVAPISFACSECGKSLKARPELAGKKVKCIQCGKAVVVPGP